MTTLLQNSHFSDFDCRQRLLEKEESGGFQQGLPSGSDDRKPLLVLEEISKSFEGRPILGGVSMKLYPAELVSLLGVSGSGKSTLFNIAAGLLHADAGRVLYKEENINGESGRIAYMLQKDLLLPHLTVLDNIALPLLIRGVARPEARARAAAQFANFGLEGCEKQYPSQLSGGMAQRAAFLRTWLFSSETVLLDEPFSALDAITKKQLHLWFLKLLERFRMSVLLITHDIDEALLLSERIYILSPCPGRLIAEIVLPAGRKKDADSLLEESMLKIKKDILHLLGQV